MHKPSWEQFFNQSVRDILLPGSTVLDIGAGLRIDASRGNRVDMKRAWIKPLAERVTYLVLDPVATYHPDIVGDVMALPMEADQYDAVLCLAVLEHVPRPWDAVREMLRVLKPGGTLFAYVPFLSPYHAMPGYYGDYFRFTEDGIRALCEHFVDVRVAPVRGPMETLTHLLPGRQKFLRRLANTFDRWRRGSGKQVSGFYFTAKKPLG